MGTGTFALKTSAENKRQKLWLRDRKGSPCLVTSPPANSDAVLISTGARQHAQHIVFPFVFSL